MSRKTPFIFTVLMVFLMTFSFADLPEGPYISPVNMLDPDGTLALSKDLNQDFDLSYHTYEGPGFFPSPLLLSTKTPVWTWDDQFIFPGQGINGSVFALAVYDGCLYAGGDFTQAGEVSASYIARWDGESWSPLGLGMNNTVFALAVHDDCLYASGWFTSADGVSASYIAEWDGGSWSPLGPGMNNSVYALAIDDACLYAGGAFTQAGGNRSHHIARWYGLEGYYNVNLLSFPDNIEVILTGAGHYSVGEIVYISAELTKGYEFVEWTGDHVYLLYDATAPATFFYMPDMVKERQNRRQYALERCNRLVQ